MAFGKKATKEKLITQKHIIFRLTALYKRLICHYIIYKFDFFGTFLVWLSRISNYPHFLTMDGTSGESNIKKVLKFFF